MKLFLVENEDWEHDEVDEALICADDEEEAKQIYKNSFENFSYKLKVTEVNLEKGVLHSQFHYG